MTMTSTGTTAGAREHARAQAAAITDSMPVVPASPGLIRPTMSRGQDMTWAETVPGGRYTAKVLGRGTRLRLRDVAGTGCAQRAAAGAPMHPGSGSTSPTPSRCPGRLTSAPAIPCSDQGRVLATIVDDDSGHHDALCGTSTLAGNTAKYGAGELYSQTPAGRELFVLAAAKHGLHAATWRRRCRSSTASASSPTDP